MQLNCPHPDLMIQTSTGAVQAGLLQLPSCSQSRAKTDRKAQMGLRAVPAGLGRRYSALELSSAICQIDGSSDSTLPLLLVPLVTERTMEAKWTTQIRFPCTRHSRLQPSQKTVHLSQNTLDRSTRHAQAVPVSISCAPLACGFQ